MPLGYSSSRQWRCAAKMPTCRFDEAAAPPVAVQFIAAGTERISRKAVRERSCVTHVQRWVKSSASKPPNCRQTIPVAPVLSALPPLISARASGEPKTGMKARWPHEISVQPASMARDRRNNWSVINGE